MSAAPITPYAQSIAAKSFSGALESHFAPVEAIMLSARAILISTLLLLTPSLAGAAPQCKSNGCGPEGYIGRLVPDRFFNVCVFKPCCDSHDICYGRCLDCGDLHGSPDCQDKAKRKVRKASCDQALYDDINSLNRNSLVCSGFAYAYRWAVGMAGDGFFFGMVMSAEAEAKFRNDFDAALAYYEFETSRGDTAAITESLSAARFVSNLDGIEDNKLAFRTVNNRGQLAIESQSIQSSPQFELRDYRTIELKKFLNNVDVTRMEFAGQRFDLENAIRSVPDTGVDVRALQQREQFFPTD